MVIEDMIYLIHVRGIAEYVKSSMNLEVELFFVNLEEDPPKVAVFFILLSSNRAFNHLLLDTQILPRICP
jgi:hypothetical protein